MPKNPDKNIDYTLIIDYILIIGLLIITIYFIYSTIVSNRDNNPEMSPPTFVDTTNSYQRAELSHIEEAKNGASITNTQFLVSEDNAIRHFCIKSSSKSESVNDSVFALDFSQILDCNF